MYGSGLYSISVPFVVARELVKHKVINSQMTNSIEGESKEYGE